MNMTVGELIALLEEFAPDQSVRLAVQPAWPFEHNISPEMGEADGIVYIAEAEQLGYLSGDAAEAVGWA